ncbi:MAG: hypothetical protein JWL77_3977 [Chthonomonadaceae bacterium]|nr:hypothetical protein [Chthonomonadaceae bacterium]
MAENEKPDFTVIDRRQTAQAEETSPSEPPTAAPTSAPADAGNGNASTSEAPVAANDDAEADQDPFGLPDPALLIAMAAMQTSPQELLALLAPSFDSQARRALGLISDTQTGELSLDLDTAKVAIDAVQFCLSKAEPALESAEHREMMRRLNDLRLTYVAKLQTS